MLMLTRKENQSIFLFLPNGESIEVKIAKCEGNQVRVGIEAPQDIEILREELVDLV